MLVSCNLRVAGKPGNEIELNLGGAHMLRSSLFIILAATSLAAPAQQTAPDVGQSIAQARSFARTRGDALWPGYGSAPFGFLLVSKDEEQLFCRQSVPNGFRPRGTDSATGCKRYVRTRSGLPDSLLAAMPVFGLPSTIVMGTPQSTGRSEADWTRTILHEHFHQWQDFFPKIFDRMKALDLADGDQTGMWMLNYPFPYSDPSVVSAFNAASHSLATALDARGKRVSAARYGNISPPDISLRESPVNETGATPNSSFGRKVSRAGQKFSSANATLALMSENPLSSWNGTRGPG
jgi:hypothetical protein